MASFLTLEEEDIDLQNLIEERSADLFAARADKPQLEVSRLFRKKVATEAEAMTVKQGVELRSLSDLKVVKKEPNDLLQVFIVRQERSWTTLNISKELLQEFAKTFGVFHPFWKCVFTFGCKSEEHECEFPGFRSQRISTLSTEESFESAYVIRRVEKHHRKVFKDESPWSIRQTAVYHKHKAHQPPEALSVSNYPTGMRSNFLLISPSKTAERKLNRLLDLALSEQQTIPHCLVHSLIVADGLKGWMDYVVWLEKDVKERSDPIIYSNLGSVERDFSFSVEDRQALKLTEDLVIDLKTIVSTLLNTVKGIQKHCQSCCLTFCEKKLGEKCACSMVLAEFDGYLEDIELCMERANLLRDRVFSTAQLLSDLLRYEDQRALKELTEQSQTENQTMLSLAEKSTKDAEAMKVLTIIGLVYLPTTFVANFFSTEFVQTDDSGNLNVTANSWLLAVIAMPLTMLTIVVWWLCVRYRNGSFPCRIPHRLFQLLKASFESLKRLRERPQVLDIESPEVRPVNFANKAPRRTWSTTAPTLKDG